MYRVSLATHAPGKWEVKIFHVPSLEYVYSSRDFADPFLALRAALDTEYFGFTGTVAILPE